MHWFVISYVNFLQKPNKKIKHRNKQLKVTRPNILGNNIIQLLASLGITLADASRHLDIHPAILKNLKKGHTQSIKFTTIEAIAKITGVNLDILLEGVPTVIIDRCKKLDESRLLKNEYPELFAQLVVPDNSLTVGAAKHVEWECPECGYRDITSVNKRVTSYRCCQKCDPKSKIKHQFVSISHPEVYKEMMDADPNQADLRPKSSKYVKLKCTRGHFRTVKLYSRTGQKIKPACAACRKEDRISKLIRKYEEKQKKPKGVYLTKQQKEAHSALCTASQEWNSASSLGITDRALSSLCAKGMAQVKCCENNSSIFRLYKLAPK